MSDAIAEFGRGETVWHVCGGGRGVVVAHVYFAHHMMYKVCWGDGYSDHDVVELTKEEPEFEEFYEEWNDL